MAAKLEGDDMKRVNWPFMGIVVLAILALIARAVLTKYYPAPRIIRHHFADFGFPAVVTAFVSSFINILTPVRWRRRYAGWFVWVHLAVAVAGMAQGLNIEYEDFVGEDQDGFDPGVLITGWLGVPDTDTFDWWDVAAISCGGMLVGYLQWQSTRYVRSWRRILLFVDG